MLRVVQFFEDQNKRLSMGRLLIFLAYFPAAYVVICVKEAGTLTAFLATFAGAYGVGKGIDAKWGKHVKAGTK